MYSEDPEEARRTQIYAELLQSARCGPLIDVGCGSGRQMAVLSEVCAHSTVIGADLSLEQARRARQTAPSAAVVVPSSTDLPFRQGSFTHTLCAEVLEHQPQPELTLASLRRILAPGGTLVVSTPYRERIRHVVCIHCGNITPLSGHLHSFAEGDMKDMLDRAGFRTQLVQGRVRARKLFTRLPYALWKGVQCLLKLAGAKPKSLVAVALRSAD